MRISRLISTFAIGIAGLGVSACTDYGYGGGYGGVSLGYGGGGYYDDYYGGGYGGGYYGGGYGAALPGYGWYQDF